MSKRILNLLMISLLAIWSVGCRTAGKGTTSVVILSVNDMHAKIDNFPRFKAMVDSIRQAEKYVILVSGGDNFTGNPIVDQYPEKGLPMIDFMNRTGFNVSATGNHEFDYGQEVLAKRMEQAEFPILCANVTSGPESVVKFRPYQILTLDNGIRLAFLSLVQTNRNGIPDSHPDRLKGLTFSNGLKTAPLYAGLRDSSNAFIALTHLGYDTDIRLTAELPALDMVIGGHSHTLVKHPKSFNGVLVTQSGQWVEHVTKSTLQFNRKKKLVNVKADLLSVFAFRHTDRTLDSLLTVYNENSEMNRIIGTALSNIRGKDELGSMMTDAVTSMEGIEVAFQNNGGIRIPEIPMGDISIKTIYQLDPFGNEIIVFRLTPAEIRSLLLNSYNRNRRIDLQVSGISYTVVTDENGNGLDVELKLADGSVPDEQKTYMAGMNSYIASSYKFNHRDEGVSHSTITAQALIDFISNKKALDYSGVTRAFVKQAE